MTPKNFRRSLAADDPPEGVSVALRALWYGGKGEWSRAHEFVQNEHGVDAAWVHAWLHRQEGDTENARHWYDKAGVPEANGNVEEEWRDIAFALLTRGD